MEVDDSQRLPGHRRTSIGSYQSTPRSSKPSTPRSSKPSKSSQSADTSTHYNEGTKPPTFRSRSARMLSSCFRAPSVKETETEADVREIDLSRTSFSTTASNFGKQGNTDFSLQGILKATDNFSETNKIGEGHFGTIYRGRLGNGTVVAVKRAKKNEYGKHSSTEFNNEIKTLSSIQHFHLVRFLGYIEEFDERIIVVEYVGNGNLRTHLNGYQGRVLEIADRLQIAIDTAHAVTYLHSYADHPIIHRDIKATNILITDRFRAKVADFGFAREIAEDTDATHVMTLVKGTAGYLDPEYLKTFQLTEKSDVYSFGVVLVELVTGRRPIESKRRKERMTTAWAIRKHNEGTTVTVMDPKLTRSPASIEVVGKILDLAQQCLAPSKRHRPTMKKCAEILWEIRKNFQDRRVLNATSPTHCKDNMECQFTKDSSDLSSTSASTKFGVKLVRDGAAWGMDHLTHREGMAEASSSHDDQVTQPAE